MWGGFFSFFDLILFEVFQLKLISQVHRYETETQGQGSTNLGQISAKVGGDLGPITKKKKLFGGYEIAKARLLKISDEITPAKVAVAICFHSR